MGRLAGKKAIVLGAAGRDNMGQVMARRFRDEGAEVLVAGRNMQELERFAAEIGGHAAVCDITKKADLQALAAKARSSMGGADIAVNATGWGLLKPFLENTEDELQRMSALQFIGPFMFFQEMIALMMPENGGHGGSIIQISSATATIMVGNHAAYMGTKAGTDHVVRVAANDFGSHGIRVNSISPGFTETPMTAEHIAVPGLMEAFLKAYPLGRIGTKEDVAAAAVFLASDECFMTGENLQVNGGLTLRRNPTPEEIGESIAKHSA